MIRHTFLLLMLGAFFNVSQSLAAPILNTAADGFEDLKNPDGSYGSAFGYYQNSGELMYLQAGNNNGTNFNDGTVESAVENWLMSHGHAITPDSFILFDSTASVTITNYDTSGNIVPNSTYDDSGNSLTNPSNSGTWEVTPAGSVLSFYAVKAGENYAMYFVHPAEGTGSWSTFDLWQEYGNGSDLQISHFNGYNLELTAVPEPTTFILFITGFIGIAGLRSRKRGE